jgi:hypothetical protein
MTTGKPARPTGCGVPRAPTCTSPRAAKSLTHSRQTAVYWVETVGSPRWPRTAKVICGAAGWYLASAPATTGGARDAPRHHQARPAAPAQKTRVARADCSRRSSTAGARSWSPRPPYRARPALWKTSRESGRVTVRREQRYERHSWAFFQLRQVLAYQAHRAGVWLHRGNQAPRVAHALSAGMARRRIGSCPPSSFASDAAMPCPRTTTPRSTAADTSGAQPIGRWQQPARVRCKPPGCSRGVVDAWRIVETRRRDASLTLPMAEVEGCSENAPGTPARSPPKGLPGPARR